MEGLQDTLRRERQNLYKERRMNNPAELAEAWQQISGKKLINI